MTEYWISVTDDRACKMSIWFFSGEDKCPITTLSVQSSNSYFFPKSWTLNSRSCDWLSTHDLSWHPTDKHSHSCLFLDSFTQGWPLSGTGLPVSSLLAKMGFRVVAINIANCSLSDPVLNLLLCTGENQNIMFLLVYEACAWTICDATKRKKLELILVIDILLWM